MVPLVILPVEREFLALIEEAETLPVLLRSLAGQGKPDMMDGDDLPEATLRRLEAWAVPEYRGALRLIRHADVAFAAEVLVRALVEFYAQVAWIHEGPTGDSRSQATRAACLELGIASEANEALTKKLSGWGTADPRVHEAAIQRLTDIQAIHAATGCRCSGQKWQVQPILKQADAGGIQWPYGLWVISSAAAHQLLPGRVEVDLGDGTSDFLSIAHYAWRAALLEYVMRAFGLAGVRILDMINPAHAETLRVWIERFVTDQRMVDASHEKFDHVAMEQMNVVRAGLHERAGQPPSG